MQGQNALLTAQIHLSPGPGSSEDAWDIQTLSDDEDLRDDDVTSSQPRSRPIYDPLCCPHAPDAQPIVPMSIIDFLAWDIAKANPWLGLEESIAGLTEDVLESVEILWGF